MNKREFNKTIRQVSTKNIIDLKKVANLPDEIKSELVYFIVRFRGPVLKEFIPSNFDISWLNCCGYLYETTGKKSGFTFVHTCENKIV